MQKFRTTVMLPSEVRKEMLKSIINFQYGLRGKSKWICEAVDNLIAMPNFLDYVSLSDDIDNLTEAEVFQIPIDIRGRLDTAVLDVRQNLPKVNAVQSCIIRAGIIQRILRNY